MTPPRLPLDLLWAKRLDPPRCGYWLARARVGPRGLYGPLVPAAIMLLHTTAEPGEEANKMDRSPFYAGFFAGAPVSVWTLQQAPHTDPEFFVRREREIDEAEYLFRCAEADWAREYAPTEAIAAPRKAVDLLQTALPF